MRTAIKPVFILANRVGGNIRITVVQNTIRLVVLVNDLGHPDKITRQQQVIVAHHHDVVTRGGKQRVVPVVSHGNRLLKAQYGDPRVCCVSRNDLSSLVRIGVVRNDQLQIVIALAENRMDTVFEVRSAIAGWK